MAQSPVCPVADRLADRFPAGGHIAYGEEVVQFKSMAEPDRCRKENR